jgi:hypothetical protein
VASEKPKPVPVEVLAKRLHDKYCAELAAGRRGTGKPVGRPLDGAEPKMHLNARVEPATVLELHSMTDKNASELLVEMHKLLSMAKNGAQAQEILKALESVLTTDEKAKAS